MLHSPKIRRMNFLRDVLTAPMCGAGTDLVGNRDSELIIVIRYSIRNICKSKFWISETR